MLVFMRIARFISLLLLISSCSNGLEPYGATFSGLMKNENGLFRGLQPGDTRDFVRRSESFDPFINEPKQLSYEIPLADDGFMVVNYGFENDTLYEISMELYVEKMETATKIIRNFIKYYDKKFGSHAVEGGFCVWKTEHPVRKTMMTIEMSEESEFETMGNWSFIIYDYSLALLK